MEKQQFKNQTFYRRRILKRQKFIAASQAIMENSCIFGNLKMRHCFLQVSRDHTKLMNIFCRVNFYSSPNQVQQLVGRLTDMGVTEVLPRKTYNIKDFFARQSTLVEDFGNNFGDFRNLVCHVSLFDLSKKMNKSFQKN